MLLERSQLLVGLIAAAVIGAGTVFAVFLSAGAFESGYRVRAEFANAAGLAAGDDVLVAGVRAGTVTGIQLEDGRIVVELAVRTELPTDSRARIINANVLGARALELVAGDAWDQLLQDAEGTPTIPLERTSVPVTLPELGDETVALLRDADVDAFATLVGSLADITEGQREEVGRLLDGLRDFSAVVARDRADLRAFIGHGATVVDALADRDSEIVRIVDAFGSTVAQLNDRRDRLVGLLEEVRDASRLTADLLEDEHEALDRVLFEIDAVLDLLDRHQVDVAHAVAYGGVAFDGFASVGRSGAADNPYWGNILTTSIGEGGIDATFGCGGTIDTFLDEIFGPAECPEESSPPEQGVGDAQRSVSRLPRGLAAFFAWTGDRP